MRHLQRVQEICPTTQRRHWQFAVWFRHAIGFNGATRAFPNCHAEPRKGTFEQARVYCTLGKGLTPRDTTGVPGTEASFGETPKPGTRTDLQRICGDFLKSGYSAVPDAYVLRFNRHFEYLRNVRKRATKRKTSVHWFYGPTGTGKSFLADQMAGEDAYWAPLVGGWFDFYDGQPNIVFDEYDGQFTTAELLRLFDWTKNMPKVKGSHTVLPPVCNFFVTSHAHPSTFVHSDRWPELERRITQLHFLEKPFCEGLVLPLTTSSQEGKDQKI